MKEVMLSCGCHLRLDENATDNMEFIDALAEMAEDDFTAVSKVLVMILGKEQRKKLYDHLRTPDGRVPIKAVSDCVLEIFDKMGQQGKNF